MEVKVDQHETSGMGSFTHNKGTSVKKTKQKGIDKTLTQRQSKQNIIPNINERPSAAVFTDFVNQHFSLLVEPFQRRSR
jgi:hypothetical protein